MSFRCGICDVSQPPCTVPVIVVTEFRKRSYTIANGKSLGAEIVSEIKACKECASEIKELQGAGLLHENLRHNMSFSTKPEEGNG